MSTFTPHKSQVCHTVFNWKGYQISTEWTYVYFSYWETQLASSFWSIVFLLPMWEKGGRKGRLVIQGWWSACDCFVGKGCYWTGWGGEKPPLVLHWLNKCFENETLNANRWFYQRTICMQSHTRMHTCIFIYMFIMNMYISNIPPPFSISDPPGALWIE